MWKPCVLALAIAACGPVSGGEPDLSAPKLTLTGTPSELDNHAEARFEFSADQPSTFQCRLDSGPATPCESPQRVPVADGTHEFEIAAISEFEVAGDPVRYDWIVDTAAPTTELLAAPAALDNSVSVRFEFQANEPASFTCVADGAESPCSSPHTIDGLADGAHTFEVRATDRAGNAEVAAAPYRWTLDSSTPDTSIDVGPSGAVAATTTSFTFSSADVGAGGAFECSLDGSAFASCTSPSSLADLAQGEHSFRVRVRDATQNLDPTPAERTWTVDTFAPAVAITAPTTTNLATPTLTFTISGGETTPQCRVDSDAFAPCTTATTHTTRVLADGSHGFDVQVADLAGNMTTAHATFVVDAPPTIAFSGEAADGELTTTSSSITISFSVAGSFASNTLRCAVDGVTGICTTTTTHTVSLNAGQTRVLQVSAADAGGNLGSATVSITRRVVGGANP